MLILWVISNRFKIRLTFFFDETFNGLCGAAGFLLFLEFFLILIQLHELLDLGLAAVKGQAV